MKSVVRFSEAANLAVHSLVWMVAQGKVRGGAAFSATEIGQALGVSGSHLAKVLQGLARKGIVKSVRGLKGGFSLAGNPADITFLSIVESVDGPIELGGCLLGNSICGPGACRLAPMHRAATEMVVRELSALTLAGFVEGLQSAQVEPPAARKE